MDILVWIGIGLCITQSAMFSGLNLAFFSISKLRLEILAKNNNEDALKIMMLRRDANFLLTTILWGNVAVNVLLTLLSNSVMAGISAFLFSTIIITFFGEIMPQAYFSKHAMRTASLLAPVLRFYQYLLYPVAKPSSMLLDKWLGSEAIHYYQEKDLRQLLKMHVSAPGTDIEHMEGKGALNFLDIDDVSIIREGELIAPESIITIPFINNKPVFPEITLSSQDDFLKKINQSQKKWVILVDEQGSPRLALDSNALLRDVLFNNTLFDPRHYCHRPIIIIDSGQPLGEAIMQLEVHPQSSADDVIDKDIIILWDQEKRIITGSDILGRLLRGIVRNNEHGSKI